MDDTTEWTPLDKVLFTTALPLIVMFAVLALITIAMRPTDAGSSPAAAAAPAPVATAAQRAEAKRQSLRDSYEECVESNGGGYPRYSLRGRLMSRGDAAKRREAIAVCRAVVDHLDGPPSARAQNALPIA